MTTVPLAPTGNHVIFIHPDGASPSYFGAARFLQEGPDSRLNWDRMARSAVYLGHMEDQLTGTSNAAAVTHATGVKVYNESFGFEVRRNPDGTPVISTTTGRVEETDIISAAGRRNSTIMQDAVQAGKATALINTGVIAEPGTGTFVARVGQNDIPSGAAGFDRFPRAQFAEITRQVVLSGIDVILGGGLLNYLPVGAVVPTGAAEMVAADPFRASLTTNTSVSQRPTANLIDLAIAQGYTVVYTEAQLNAVVANPAITKVLGIFAVEDTFLDRTEEALTGLGINPLDPFVSTAPDAGEMLSAALTIMQRNPKFARGSFTVLEEEGTDNFGNNDNATGSIQATLRADRAIGVALNFVEKNPRTLVITAADSEAGGLQVRDEQDADTVAGSVRSNPTTVAGISNPFDGQSGRGTAEYVAAPDADGDRFPFSVGWVATPDFAGSIVTKAHGLNANRLPATIDNTEIYRLMHETLFNTTIAPRVATPAPAPAPTSQRGSAIFIHPDGASPAHYGALRFTDLGPDGRLNWDRMTSAGVYLGHMENQLTGTSNAAAVTHATGVKVFNESFGLDEDNLPVVAGSGAVGKTIMDEAVAAGKGTALVQSGHIGEPGTAAFVAKTTNRAGTNPDLRARQKTAEIAEQVIRSGVDVILGGGEVYLRPIGTAGFHGTAAQLNAITTLPEDRPTTDLIVLAQSLGYTVVFTEAQLNAALAQPTPPQRLLGVFAPDDTFNALPEEVLIRDGLPLYVPTAPTIAEMLDAALRIVGNNPNGFFVVVEEEGTDNFANSNNARGTIEAVRRADAAIGVAMNFVRNNNPNTLVLTAADSDAGGLQVWQPTPFTTALPTTLTAPQTLNANPTGTAAQNVLLPQDGSSGSVAPVTTFGTVNTLEGLNPGNFTVGWVGTPDFPGSIVSRAFGFNSELLGATVDNTEMYELLYRTIFGINGGAGNDVINGTTSNDIIFGEGGNDQLNGRDGDDNLSGGTGNDTLNGGSGNDTVQEVYPGISDGQFIVTSSSLRHTGVGSTNLLTDGLGFDRYIAIERVDITGGSGNELFDARLFAAPLGVIFDGGAGNDTLNGGFGNDTLNGGFGNDTLDGGTGNDTLNGGFGNDTLVGGTGNDILTGGTGSDRFVFSTRSVFNATTVGNDTVTDFTVADDFIVLNRTTFAALTGGSQAGTPITGTEFAVIASGGAAQAGTQTARIVYESSTGALFYNQDGAASGLGSGGQFATLTGAPNLTPSNILVVV